MKQTLFLQTFLIAYVFIGFYLFLFLSSGTEPFILKYST